MTDRAFMVALGLGFTILTGLIYWMATLPLLIFPLPPELAFPVRLMAGGFAIIG